jgi:O-acetylhomoserine/O-acetylserine sulfhydrylase-like pyridoxal-dependent enzyme
VPLILDGIIAKSIVPRPIAYGTDILVSSLATEARQKMSIKTRISHLSIGIEDEDNFFDDLGQAMESA